MAAVAPPSPSWLRTGPPASRSARMRANAERGADITFAHHSSTRWRARVDRDVQQTELVAVDFAVGELLALVDGGAGDTLRPDPRHPRRHVDHSSGVAGERVRALVVAGTAKAKGTNTIGYSRPLAEWTVVTVTASASLSTRRIAASPGSGSPTSSSSSSRTRCGSLTSPCVAATNSSAIWSASAMLRSPSAPPTSRATASPRHASQKSATPRSRITAASSAQRSVDSASVRSASTSAGRWPPNHPSAAARTSRGSFGAATAASNARHCSAASESNTEPVRERTAGMRHRRSSAVTIPARRCDGTSTAMSPGSTARSRSSSVPRRNRPSLRRWWTREATSARIRRRAGGVFNVPLPPSGNDPSLGTHADVQGRRRAVVERRLDGVGRGLDRGEAHLRVAERGALEEGADGVQQASVGAEVGDQADGRRCRAPPRGTPAGRRRGTGRWPAWGRRR